MRRTSILFALVASASACAAPVGAEDGAVHEAGTADVAADAPVAMDVRAVDTPELDVVTPDDTVIDDAPSSDTGASADSGIDLEMLARRRAACDFAAGDHVADTIGLTRAERTAIPLRHLIVYVGENRSFDHYLGRLPAMGRSDVDGIPAGYTNPRDSGGTASPSHAGTTCISPDVPHGWNPMHTAWNAGQMDQFFNVADSSTSSGQRALTYYDERDIPFYTYLYNTFAISDRFFSSVLGPTWPNRDYLYAATSDGVKNTFERQITVRSIFDAMTAAHVTWKVYAAGSFREGCINWTSSHAGVSNTTGLFNDIMNDTLPQVSFIDGPDDHPPANIQVAEAFARRVYVALRGSPAWATSALVMSYDEAGGFFDHVPPPAACRPDGTLANSDFNRLGVRVPLVVISPWARPGYASHVRAETASITRLIEALHDLPALTNRDANVNALLDMFDFSAPHLMSPPAAPAAGTGGCP